MANLIEFTDDNFADLTKEGLVLVDFWAPWCGPCRVVGPIIEELAGDYEGKVKVGKLNVDDHMAVAQQFRVMSIPTVILFKDSQAVEIMIGSQSKSAYEQRLAKYLPEGARALAEPQPAATRLMPRGVMRHAPAVNLDDVSMSV